MHSGDVVYCRRSKEDKGNKSLSLDNQEATCREFAARQGWTVRSAHRDNGVSGDSYLGDRPGLLAALRDLTSGAKLIVLRRERLFRADEFVRGEINRAIEGRGAEVWSTQGEGSGDRTSSGMIFRGIVDLMSYSELLKIRERTRESLDRKRGDGLRVGQLAYGMDVSPDGLSVVPSHHDADVVELARAFRDEGLSIRGIIHEFQQRRIRPKNAGRVRLDHLERLQQLLAEGLDHAAAADVAGVPPEAVAHVLALTREGRPLKAVAALLPGRLPAPDPVEPWSVTSIRRLLGDLPCPSKARPSSTSSAKRSTSSPGASTPSPTRPRSPDSPSADSSGASAA